MISLACEASPSDFTSNIKHLTSNPPMDGFAVGNIAAIDLEQDVVEERTAGERF